MDAEIEVTEGDYHYDDYDICNQWFSVRCTGDPACNLDDFQVASINTYPKNKNPKPMSNALVSYIKKEHLDAVAADLLSRYYPEALKTPMVVEPKKLISKMGLAIKLRDITKDLSVFGQIYFVSVKN